MNTSNKLTLLLTVLLFTLLNFSCVKQYQIDDPDPRVPLLRNMYLQCNSNLDPEIKDYINFMAFDKRHCIVQNRVDTRDDCRVKQIENQINLSLFNCLNLFDLNGKYTLSLHALSLSHNLEHMQSGQFDFYDGIQELTDNKILVSLHFRPRSLPTEKYPADQFPVFSSIGIHQDSNSYFKITQIDTFFNQSNKGIRIHYEFNALLQDSLGRVLPIINGLGINSFVL